MRRAVVGDDFARFREHARALLAADVPPDAVEFVDDACATMLFADDAALTQSASPPRVPRSFVEKAERAACHRDPRRWALLYRILWRVAHGEPALLEVPTDPDVRALDRLDGAVRREIHKTHAFVRFTRVEDDGERFLAWHGAEHRVLRLASALFVDRFGAMRWSILTAHDAAHWDGAALRFTDGVPRREGQRAVGRDELASLWTTYYAHIFNPARLRPAAMRKEMPRRHWATLPEAELLESLMRTSVARAEAMTARGAPAVRLPDVKTLPVLRDAARVCDACELCVGATQAVFGEGAPSARLMLVGEQPGDEEDRAGRPFVGPAGAVLDAALADAGIDRRALYLTNAVKHFRHRVDGPRRLHRTPRAKDLAVCRPWLDAEIAAVRPSVIVALGRCAARSLLGPVARDDLRGQFVEAAGGATRGVWVTWHPAAVLRAPDGATRACCERELREHLRAAWQLAEESHRLKL